MYRVPYDRGRSLAANSSHPPRKDSVRASSAMVVPEISKPTLQQEASQADWVLVTVSPPRSLHSKDTTTGRDEVVYGHHKPAPTPHSSRDAITRFRCLGPRYRGLPDGLPPRSKTLSYYQKPLSMTQCRRVSSSSSSCSPSFGSYSLLMHQKYSCVACNGI